MINHIERICINCMKEKPDTNVVCPHCGFNPKEYHPAPTHLPPFTILYGKYLIGRVVGQGGFGIVYIAKDLVLDITVAIKELFPSNMVTRTISNVTTSTSVMCTDDPKNLSMVREKFVKEARTIARLQEHAGAGGIVQVKDLFEENNTAYLVMEYLHGETLKQYLEKYGNIECPQLLRMLRPVMESLHNIHQADIIHRDISPDNIMVMSTAESRQSGGTPLLKLLDFGNVKIQDASYDGSKSVIMAVKKGYSPIEQYSSEGQIGPWTDVYAMCATIYRCLTGKLPPEPTALAGGSITPPSQLGIRIPSSTEKALMKGLALNFHERTQNMGELIAGLYENPKASAIAPDPSYEPARKKKSIVPVVIGGLAGILILAGLFWYFSSGKKEDSKTVNQSESVLEVQTDAPSPDRSETPTATVAETEKKSPKSVQSDLPSKEKESEEEKASSQTVQGDLPLRTEKEDAPETASDELPAEESDSTPSDQDIVAPVIKKINSLPETVSSDEEESILDARKSYDELTEKQKDLVPSESLEKLIAAEESLETIKKEESEAQKQLESDQEAADLTIQKIRDLPDDLKLDDESDLQSAQESYDTLTDSQKELVSASLLEKLEDSQAQIDSLRREESEAVKQSESNQAAADEVIQKIDALADEITLDDAAFIQEANDCYNNLSNEQKNLVPESTYRKLLESKANLNILQQSVNENQDSAQEVIEVISLLPDYVTAEDESAISSARSSYDALSEDAKSLVTNYSRLQDAEAQLETVKQASQQQTAWETCKTYYAQKLKDVMNLYEISPSANPFDGEVKGLCYSTLAGDTGTGLPYLILCWRGDNDLALQVDGEGKYYAYFYEICSWDGTQVVTSLASGTDAANASNYYWLSQIDGINYWVTWRYNGNYYDMIPLNSPGTRKTFYQDVSSGQYYVNQSVVDEDTFLQMCSMAEASNNDPNVSMTRTTGYLDTTDEAWYNPTSIEETYKELTGSSLVPERSESTWKKLYRNYLKKLNLHKEDTARIGLAHLNDDDIPEMVIKQTSDALYYIIVTSDGSSLNIAMAPYGNLKGTERSNQFMLWGQPDDYFGFAYVLYIEDGAFHWDSHGRFCVKEITEKKGNYMWNNKALSGPEEYNSVVSQQIPGGIDLIPNNTFDEVCSQMDNDY